MKPFKSDKEKYEALKARLRYRIWHIRRTWSHHRDLMPQPKSAGKSIDA